MHPAAILPFFSTLAGGFAALRLQHRIHSLMALASGVVVATAIAELLPEALELAADNVVGVGVAAVVGYIGFSLLEAFLHQASFEHAGDHGDHGHEPGAEHGAERDAEQAHGHHDARPRSGAGLLGLLPPMGLVAHSVMDGLAIGLAFQAGDEIGFIVLVAVLLHDFADGMNVATIALDAARGERLAVAFVILDAVAAPVGGLLSTLVRIDPQALGLLLALFAGVFIAVGAGHLLPESQHRDPRHGPALVLLAAVGAAIVLVVRAITPA
jgi:ZIP family zinc transporter